METQSRDLLGLCVPSSVSSRQPRFGGVDGVGGTGVTVPVTGVPPTDETDLIGHPNQVACLHGLKSRLKNELVFGARLV